MCRYYVLKYPCGCEIYSSRFDPCHESPNRCDPEMFIPIFCIAEPGAPCPNHYPPPILLEQAAREAMEDAARTADRAAAREAHGCRTPPAKRRRTG